ncbi:UDP-N-acetylglucosamine 2-epimerase [Chryseobacterium sp. CT-SW4]|uniref:UDP-N-acetylglucosamine 2-epimerase n=1 Tax=Chryseobacterium sp. SW-1 TaxID=3157343 RepID=UPI003B012B3F
MMKVCIATGTRAEYGLLKPLMEKMVSDPFFDLKILVTGAHLSPEFGLTYQQIERDGFTIDEKVEMLLSADTSESIVKSMGVAMIGFADALKRLNPDLLILLGDRYEMLSLASSALIFKIPIAHIHGGEITTGAYDDAIRHAITKMAHYHFASTEEYRNRIIQLGESPANVYNVGAIGLDNIVNLNLLTKAQLESELDIKFKKYNYQITFHPATLDNTPAEQQFNILLDALDEQEDSFFIFTKANADTNGRIINSLIDQYVAQNPQKSKAFSSLGSLRFLSVLQHSHAIVGNSSSGIIEAPSLKIPTINIGHRQSGRTQADTVINVEVNKEEIVKAFEKVKDQKFISTLDQVKNPYGVGNTAEKIIKVLKEIKPDFVKNFYDLNG